ncbi:MAG: PrgI family protein, partial [Candidatus Saccharimonas sp.]
MAVYKVAQDVEADDKLIGPFSFRQFIYLIIVVLSGALAWGLSRVFIGLAVVPLPVILFFGALALPLRKDQPMEIYLAAILSFYLKPHKRFWEPDGIESLVEITAPKVVEVQRTKTLSEDETERRLSFLADIADTQGWSVRHATAPPPQTSMVTDAYYAAQQTEDVLDSSGGVAQTLNTMIDHADAKRREEMLARMHPVASPASTPQVISETPVVTQSVIAALTPQQISPFAPAVAQDDVGATLPVYNPYPSQIHQAVIQPLSAQPPAPQPSPEPVVTTSETPLSPDI